MLPGVRLVNAPGHTSGHAAFVVGSGNQQLMMSNDTFYVAWLPRGTYRVEVMLPRAMTAGAAQYKLEVLHQVSMAYESADASEGVVDLPVRTVG